MIETFNRSTRANCSDRGPAVMTYPLIRTQFIVGGDACTIENLGHAITEYSGLVRVVIGPSNFPRRATSIYMIKGPVTMALTGVNLI